MHLVKYVFVYPPGYVPSDWDAPEGYTPTGSIEDYDLAFVPEAPVVGHQFDYYGDNWIIAQVQLYHPLEQLEGCLDCFHITLCTWDGSVPGRNHWHDGKAPLLVIPATVEGELILDQWGGASWSLVEREEWISPNKGWQIQTLQHFEPVGERLPGDFDTIVVAWSLATGSLEVSPTQQAAA